MRRFALMCLSFAAAVLFGGCHGHAAGGEEVDRIVDVLGIGSGTTVADVGAGDGAYSLALAERVGPDGSVYATELGEESVAALQAAVGRNSGNIQVLAATAVSTGLPEACCEAILLRHVYHHLSAPRETLASLHRALKPGGRLLVIDFPPSGLLEPWAPDDVPDDRGGHGVGSETILREAQAAGFVQVEVIDDWPGERFLDPYGVVLDKLLRVTTPR